VVKVANDMPHRYGKKGELLIDYEDTEQARDAERRRSSVVGVQPSGGVFGQENEKGEKITREHFENGHV
jgi:hypothetical protein